MQDEGPLSTENVDLGKSAMFSSSTLQELAEMQARPAARPSAVAARATSYDEESLAIIQPSDAAEQEDRLESVCELLRIARYPYSPINGCITLVPFAAASASPQEIEELAKAVNTDLQTLYTTLQVRYPVTAIFTGLEGESGFRELMRRVGPERCAANRFGMGYDLRSPASSSEIGTFAAHVCGVFEDWVYGLFREDQVLKRPGNSYLFSLLCRIRSSFKDRLSALLTQGFGYNDRLKPEDAPFLFSGCYFVASGATHDQRAFIQGIAEKLDGEQDRLEWNRQALSRDRRARRLVVVAFAMIGILTALLITMIVVRPPWSR
jgi:type VI protein secretion system component VasK